MTCCRNFLEDHWCINQEFIIAHQRATEGHTKIIPVLMDDVQLKELPVDLQAYIRVNGYINFSNYDQQSLRKRIRFMMPNLPFMEILKQKEITISTIAEQAENEESILTELDEITNAQDEEGRGDPATDRKIIRMLREDGTIWEMVDDIVL